MTACYYIRLHCRACGVYSAAVRELPVTCLKPHCTESVAVVALAKTSANYPIPWVEGKRKRYWGDSICREQVSHDAPLCSPESLQRTAES